MDRDLIITNKNLDLYKQFAKDVKKYILDNNLFVNIQGKNYVYVEGWQFMGGMLGIEAIPTELNNLNLDFDSQEYKYSCTVELKKDDRLVGRGYAICSNAEAKKKSFDEYAIASMAQTRAVGKAYRLKIGWLMKLTGYEGTPAEEILDYDSLDNEKATEQEKDEIVEMHKETVREKAKRLYIDKKADKEDDQSLLGQLRGEDE
jgi:hypothetical protein